MSFHVPNQYRMRQAREWSSEDSDGNNGAFVIPPSVLHARPQLFCIASDGMGWEHVSVSIKSRCPTWEEMCFIKDLFWDKEDCVIQYHPPKSDYVNNYPFCLHLWRPIGVEIPRPPSITVGYKDFNDLGAQKRRR